MNDRATIGSPVTKSWGELFLAFSILLICSNLSLHVGAHATWPLSSQHAHLFCLPVVSGLHPLVECPPAQSPHAVGLRQRFAMCPYL